MKMLLTAAACALSVTALAGQDPLTALPDSCSKQFENEWVRVVRVYYAPNAKLPAHAHNGRFFREAVADGENVEKVQFENEQVRISRVICAPGRSLRLAAKTAEPSLLLALQPAQLRESNGEISLRPGQARWIAAAASLAFDNRGSGPAEFLRFDFKTAPIASSALPPQR